jgi:hypothetical protein
MLICSLSLITGKLGYLVYPYTMQSEFNGSFLLF